MRLLNFLLAVAFLVMASLQVNTGNAVLWILLFGCMAVVCVFGIFNFFPRAFLFSLLGVVVVVGVYTGLQGTLPNPDINGPVSLAACLLVVAFQLIRSYRIN